MGATTYYEIKHEIDNFNERYNEDFTIEQLVGEDNSLDRETREHFHVDSFALELWDCYTIGDANEQEVLAAAGYTDIEELLSAMNAYYYTCLSEMVEEYIDAAKEEKLRMPSSKTSRPTNETTTAISLAAMILTNI